MSPDERDRLTAVEVNMTNMRGDLNDLKELLNKVVTDVASIKSTLDQARGGWKLLLMVAGIGGLVGGFGHKILMIIGLIRQ